MPKKIILLLVLAVVAGAGLNIAQDKFIAIPRAEAQGMMGQGGNMPPPAVSVQAVTKTYVPEIETLPGARNALPAIRSAAAGSGHYYRALV